MTLGPFMKICPRDPTGTGRPSSSRISTSMTGMSTRPVEVGCVT